MTDQQTDLRGRIAAALDTLQGTAHHLPPKTRERVEEVVTAAAVPPPAGRAAVLREAAEVADRIAVAMGKAEEDWASRARWACASIGAELRRMARLDEHPPETELAQRIAAKRSEGAFVEAAALSSSAGPLLAAEAQQQPDTETRAHVGGNAEDCPACHGTNPPYPFICPGPDLQPAAADTGEEDSGAPG